MRPPSTRPLAILLVLTASLLASPVDSRAAGPARAEVTDVEAWPESIWPPGSDLWRFESLEGVILLPATLRGATGRDTTGLMVLDTGAGYLAVDRPLARWLGLSDTTAADSDESVGVTDRRLERAVLGRQQIDQIYPVLTIDAEVIRNVTDRPVLGLLGQAQFANAALAVDYRAHTVATIPLGAPEPAREVAPNTGDSDPRSRMARSRARLGAVVPADAIAVPFRLAGDGKILVTARIAAASGTRREQDFTLIVDTGATKSVLFEESLEARSTRYTSWPALHGLTAPTLFGTADAFVTRAPRLELAGVTGRVRRDGLDLAIIRSELRPMLTRLVGEPVDGLLGYTFLKYFRVVLDYPDRILWLSPQPAGWDDRPYEYSQIGVQVERRDGEPQIVAVVEGSPAAQAGIRPGDAILALDDTPVTQLDIIAISERLEGPPGSAVELRVRRGGIDLEHRIERRWLLAP